MSSRNRSEYSIVESYCLNSFESSTFIQVTQVIYFPHFISKYFIWEIFINLWKHIWMILWSEKHGSGGQDVKGQSEVGQDAVERWLIRIFKVYLPLVLILPGGRVNKLEFPLCVLLLRVTRSLRTIITYFLQICQRIKWPKVLEKKREVPFWIRRNLKFSDIFL